MERRENVKRETKQSGRERKREEKRDRRLKEGKKM